MKKLLISVLIILSILSTPVHAQTSLDYYQKLFKAWGIKADTLTSEKSNEPATKKDLQTLADQISGKSGDAILEEGAMPAQATIASDKYLLILESQKGEKLPAYQQLIVITKTSPSDLYPNESSSSAKILELVRPTSINGISYYTVPEVLLIAPHYQKLLGDYFKALAKAGSAGSVREKEKTPANVSANLLKNLKENSLVESASYALILLVVVLIIKRPLVLLIQNPKRFLDKKLYSHNINKVAAFFEGRSSFLFFCFIVLSLCYLPIMYVLVTKGRLINDPTYAVKFITKTLNPLNIPTYLTSKNLLKLGFLFYNCLVAFFGFLLLIPGLIKIAGTSFQKFATIKFKPGFIKWLLPVVILINLLLLVFMDFGTLTGFVALSLIVLASALLYIARRQLDYAGLFSKKDRRVVLGLMTVALLLTVAYPLYQRGQPIKYAYEPLIGIKDKVIMFPYSKKWGNDVLFEPFYYTGNSKVFADGYLIYSPNTPKVVNKPLKDFTPTENIVITARDSKAVLEAVLKKPTLLPYLTSPAFSPLLALDNASENALYDRDIKIQLTFDCSQTPSPAVVKLEVTSLNKFAQKTEQSDLTDTDNGDIKLDALNSESTEVLNFPGCAQEISPETFEVPLDAYVIPQERVLLRFRGIDAKYLLDIKLFANSQELPITSINKAVLDDTNYTLLYQPADKTKPTDLTAYSTQISKEFTVNTGFDLSVPINQLIKQGRLNNPFIIWTDKSNEIIKMDD